MHCFLFQYKVLFDFLAIYKVLNIIITLKFYLIWYDRYQLLLKLVKYFSSIDVCHFFFPLANVNINFSLKLRVSWSALFSRYLLRSRPLSKCSMKWCKLFFCDTYCFTMALIRSLLCVVDMPPKNTCFKYIYIYRHPFHMYIVQIP